MLKSVTTEIDKPVIVELAVSAMEELCRMAHAGEPLWVPGENSMEMLNEDEYLRTYSTGIGPRILGLSFEASRETSIVAFNPLKLVDILMDVVSTFTFLLFISPIRHKIQFFNVVMYISESVVKHILRDCFESVDPRSFVNGSRWQL